MSTTETGRYIVHLIFSLLNGQKPKEKPDNVSFEDIFEMSIKHNLCVMTLTAIDQLDQKPNQVLYEEWNRKRKISATQGAVQLIEKDRIYKVLEDNSIKYIPLKGCLLKEMYPKPDYREMSDLDILIQEQDREEVRKIMENLGYDTNKYGQEKDDSYRKPPFMHVEIHHKLFEELSIDRLSIKDSFLLKPFDYAVFESDSMKGSFSNENFYIYLIMHNAKHYYIRGTGIRQWIDCTVFRRHNAINEVYVKERIKKLGIDQFFTQAENLLLAWECGKDLSSDLLEMEQIIYSSGSYGSSESKIRNNVRKMTGDRKPSEMKYVLFRMFPPYRMMKAVYPVLKTVPVLLPVCWLYRIITKGLPGILGFIRELKLFRGIDSGK